MKGVTSRISLNMPRINQLERAKVEALEMTGEAIHTDLVQSQTMPRKTGALQNESTFVDTSHSNRGKVQIVSSTPYARRLYFHPEYNFHREPWERTGFKRENGELVFDVLDEGEGNPNAGGEWFAPYLAGGEKLGFAEKAFRKFYQQRAGV
ncbi:MAG: hypothetical protein Q4F79_05635 [Eubacteriales bacterium]|nr:hypothetical protein [Eubacteriales bacterium]